MKYNNITWLIIIGLVLLIIYIYNRNTENFIINTEAVNNIASVYADINKTVNFNNATATNTITAGNIKVGNTTIDASGNIKVGNTIIDASGNIDTSGNINTNNHINAHTITSDYMSLNGRINYVIPIIDWQGNICDQATLTNMINIGGFAIGTYFNKSMPIGYITEFIISNTQGVWGVFYVKLIKLLGTTYMCRAISHMGFTYIFAANLT